jgi:hypothetical protein
MEEDTGGIEAGEDGTHIMTEQSTGRAESEDRTGVTFKVDGKVVSQDEIRACELERYAIVFNEFEQKGARLERNGERLTAAQATSLSLAEQKEILASAKEALGRDAIREMYATELRRADDMWHEIAAASEYGRNLQPGYVEVEAPGITIQQFMVCNQGIVKADNLAVPSRIHPEHYSFKAGQGGEQIIIERFGQYGDPTYMHLKPGNIEKPPVPLDDDTVMVMFGNTYLASDGSDTKMIGMHQFKRGEAGGMKVKLGVLLPEAAPAEIARGHCWHLLVEFNNAIHAAAGVKVNPIQNFVLGQALKKMERKLKR